MSSTSGSWPPSARPHPNDTTRCRTNQHEEARHQRAQHEKSSSRVWTDDRPAAIDDYARRAFEASGLPAVAVAVVTPEGVVYERTLGTTALRDGVPLTPDFAFEIGSLTKSSTALAVLRLAEEGRVDLSAPVQR